MIYILSHKVPDTDSLCGSIVFQDFLKKQGKKSIPKKLGKLNKETKYILNFVGVEEPEEIQALEKGSKIALIDHNEKKQAIDNLEELEIEYVIDHHKFGNFSTNSPLYMRIEKLCSTNSILYKMYKEYGFKISEKIARLLLLSIISDSLYFRSATTTKEDIEIAEELKKIANISNLEEISKKMFDEKSDLGDLSIKEIIKYDYKEFDFGDLKAGIGTLETTNPDFSLNKKEEILKGIEEIKKEEGLDFIFLSIVDILEEKNTTICPNGIESETLKEVFGAKISNNLADLGKKMSRKKQIIPNLTKYFQ